MHEFPELLATKGHQITFFEFDEGRKFWKQELAPRRKSLQGRVYPNILFKLIRPFQLGIPGFDRLLVMLTAIPELRRLFKQNSFDAVVLLAVPTYGLQTLWLAKKHNVPVVFRALDVSHKIRSSFFAPVIKWFEKKIYKEVALISANNPAMATYCENLGNRTGLTKVHYPPLDLSHFQSAQRDESLGKSLGIRNQDRVLVYMGSFFYFSGLPSAISAFADCSKKNADLKFLLIGGGEQDGLLRRKVQELKLEDRVIFTGVIAYKDLPSYLCLGDIAINTLDSTLVANTALPNKVLQYLATGLPVISTELQGLRSVFNGLQSIAWEKDSASVILRAAEITDAELENMLPDARTRNVLKNFEPSYAVGLFEQDLKTLAEEK